MADAEAINAEIGSTTTTVMNPPVIGTSGIVAPTKPFYRCTLENYLSSTSTKDNVSETPADDAAATAATAATMTAPTHLPVQLTQAEIAKIQRDRLDAAYYAELERKAERAIKDPTRKLRWNAGISPNDEEWIAQRARFRELLDSNSIATVLEAEFEDGQRILVIPPSEDGAILQIQLQNAREYKDFFKPGARFHGVQDNMVTKLTMLKFGLPTEALTLMNVLRCDNPVDEDDPPDGPEPVPSIERIMFSEKPLEFLDLYSQRGCGYPIMRSESQSSAMLLSRLLTNQDQNVTIRFRKLSFQKTLRLEIINQVQLYQQYHHQP